MSDADDEIAPPAPPAAPPGRVRRWLRPSLRVRITLLTVLVFTLIQTALTAGLFLYVQHQRDAQLRAKLEERTASLVRAIASTASPPSNESFAALLEAEPRSILVEELLASLFTHDGKMLATNCMPAISFAMAGGGEAGPDGPPVHRQFDVPALQTPGGAPRSGRTVAARFADPQGRELVLLVAASDAFVVQLTQELRDHLLLGVPIGVAAALASGWYIAGLAVRPLTRLQEIALLLTPDSLHRRIDFGSTASEVAKLQERLNEARRRLDVGYRAQEQFAGNVAHELKTPLAIIVAQADLIRADAALPAKARQFIEVTREEALRLARLCESFLLLTRVRHGKPVQTAARPYLVNEWIMDCVEGSHALASRFRAELAPTLLDGDDMDAHVNGDHELLATMLDNLIRNACRFSPAGQTVDIDATIDATVDAETVAVRVRDYGPGVPRQMLARVFERFEHSEAGTGGRWGAGIGLQIAHGIAHMHGGAIRVENCADVGCSFTITLPLHRPPHRPTRDSPAPAG